MGEIQSGADSILILIYFGAKYGLKVISSSPKKAPI